MWRTRPARTSPAALAVIVATGLLAVACGTAPAPSPGTPAHSAATVRPVTARPGNGPGPAPGSLKLAEAVARRLLASVVFPPGTRAVPTGPVPGQLGRPAEVPGSGHLVQRHEIRAVAWPAGRVLAFLRRHVPAGLSAPGSGSTGLIARPVRFLMWSQRHPRPGLDQAGLVVGVLAAGHGRTFVRADAQVIWYPPRSRAEYIWPDRFRAVRLREQILNPRPHTVRTVITSRAVIARLAGTLNRLPADPGGVTFGCPAILASYRMTFVPAAAGQVPLVVVPGGCDSVRVTAGGRIQPDLAGGYATITLMNRLLGVSRAAAAPARR